MAKLGRPKIYTAEEIEARRKAYYAKWRAENRDYRKKRLESMSPEQREEELAKGREYNRRCREKKKADKNDKV